MEPTRAFADAVIANDGGSTRVFAGDARRRARWRGSRCPQSGEGPRRIVAEEFLLSIPGWTWERYLAEAPETQICDYEHGELIVHSPARRSHQEEVGFLIYLLRGISSRRGLGRVYNGPSVLRVPGDVGCEPDIFVVSAAEAPRVLQQEDYVDTVPVLIVEVMSKSTRALDPVTKAQEYAALGAPEYWVVDLRAVSTESRRRL